MYKNNVLFTLVKYKLTYTKIIFKGMLHKKKIPRTQPGVTECPGGAGKDRDTHPREWHLLTSLVMPPWRLTTRRALLNLATFAIVSAAKHFRLLCGESSILTITGKPPRSTILRLI